MLTKVPHTCTCKIVQYSIYYMYYSRYMYMYKIVQYSIYYMYYSRYMYMYITCNRNYNWSFFKSITTYTALPYYLNTCIIIVYTIHIPIHFTVPLRLPVNCSNKIVFTGLCFTMTGSDVGTRTSPLSVSSEVT